MASNKGFLNEQLIVEALNGKQFSEINYNLQSMMKDLFGGPDNECIIECKQVEGPYKPDIYIKYKGETKYISVKSGRANTLHGENIRDFILFLRHIGVSERTQKILLLFHYGDGTINGSGTKRMNSYEVNSRLNKLIQEANKELNSDHSLIDKVIHRMIFQGIDETAPQAGYIYFGSPEYGKIVSRKQIYTYINYRSWVYYNCLHIGPMVLKPHARYADREIKHINLREKLDCYWPNLSDELDRIGKRYSF